MGCYLFFPHNNTFVSEYDIDIGRTVSLLYGALIFIAVFFVKDQLTPELLTVVISIYFLGTLSLILDPSSFIQFQNLFIRGTNVEIIGTNTVNLEYRGIGAFAPEAGLFGGLMVFLWALTDYVHKKFKISERRYFLLIAMLFFMIIQSKSGTGLVYLVFYLSLRLLLSEMRISVKFLTIGFGATIIYLILPLVSDSLGGRGGYVLSNLLDPLGFLQTDSSLQSRIFDIYFSLQSLIDNPLGVGNNSAYVVASSYMLESELYWSTQTRGITAFGFNSSLAYLIISFGIFYLFYAIYTYFYISKASILFKCLSVLFLSVSYSAAFPAIWLLLALNKNPNSLKES